MSKPPRPHDPRYAKPGTPPTPEQIELMAAEFKARMAAYDAQHPTPAGRRCGGKP